MRKSNLFGRTLLACLLGLGLGASAGDASSGVDRLGRELTPGLFEDRSAEAIPDPAISLFSIPPEGALAGSIDRTRTIEFASNEYRDDDPPRKRTGPTRAQIRGHENEIRVTRRRATPIPRVTNSRPKPRYKQGRPGYNSSYYGRGGYGGHVHYYIGHVHHSHCGHHYYDDGYGDHFDSRTLGRSCMYGPKGKVIYKPADVICAPEDGAEPAAQPAPPPVQQPTRVRTQPEVGTEAPGNPAPAKRRAPVQPTR
jgi:hypothetical protein